MVDMLCEVPLHPTSAKTPMGIQLHLADIAVSVLGNLSSEEEVPQSAFDALLTPFYKLMAKTKSPVVLEACQSELFEELLDLPSIHEQVPDDEDVDLKIDHAAVAQRLFQLASSKETRDRNRSVLYLLKGRFDAKAASCHPRPPTSDTNDMSERESHGPAEPADVSRRRKRKSGEEKETLGTEDIKTQKAKKKRMKSTKKNIEKGLVNEPNAEDRETSSKPLTPKPDEEASSEPSTSTPDKEASSKPLTPTPDEKASSKLSTSTPPKRTRKLERLSRSEGPQVAERKRINICLENTRVKLFSKKDPIAAAPFEPSAKGGKSLLKNRTPTPVRMRYRHLVQPSPAPALLESPQRRKSLGDSPWFKDMVVLFICLFIWCWYSTLLVWYMCVCVYARRFVPFWFVVCSYLLHTIIFLFGTNFVSTKFILYKTNTMPVDYTRKSCIKAVAVLLSVVFLYPWWWKGAWFSSYILCVEKTKSRLPVRHIGVLTPTTLLDKTRGRWKRTVRNQS